MSSGDGGGEDPSGDAGAPFDDLARRVADRTEGPPADGDWEELESLADPDAEGLWERLESTTEDPAAAPSPSSPSRTDGRRGLFPEYLSDAVLWTHGAATVGALGVGLVVSLTAAAGVLPAHYWVLGLPFFVLGLVGALPVAAWVLEFWNPEELG